MARKIIIITGVAWGFLFLIGFGCNRPALGFFPLYGLYPGGFASGDPGYNPRLMTLWSALLGIAFAVLGFIGYRFRKLNAAVAFLALLLVSAFVFIARAAAVFDQLH
jgi:hypothetical protein